MSEQDIRRIVREELAASKAEQIESIVFDSTLRDGDEIVISKEQEERLYQLAAFEKRMIYAASEPRTNEKKSSRRIG